MRVDYETKLKELFKNDKLMIRSLNTGIRKGEEMMDLFDRAIKRGTLKTNLNYLMSAFLEDEIKESSKFKFHLDKTKNIDLFKHLSKMDETKIDNFLLELIGHNQEMLHLCKKQFFQYLEDCQESETIDDERVPFIAPEVLVMDKEAVKNEINIQMLRIANIVLKTQGWDIKSFDEYGKDVFNACFNNMKKRKRYQIAGRAEMLRWHISLYDMRVENIGHKMLSYIIEQCRD